MLLVCDCLRGVNLALLKIGCIKVENECLLILGRLYIRSGMMPHLIEIVDQVGLRNGFDSVCRWGAVLLQGSLAVPHLYQSLPSLFVTLLRLNDYSFTLRHVFRDVETAA